jgi:hypothetical protein
MHEIFSVPSHESTSIIFATILDFPPVNLTSGLLHTSHLATVEQEPNIIRSLPHSRHFTLRKRDRGFGINSFSGKEDLFLYCGHEKYIYPLLSLLQYKAHLLFACWELECAQVS